MPKCITLNSGGLDSTILAYHIALNKQWDQVLLFIDYGQLPLQQELASVVANAADLRVNPLHVSMREMFSVLGEQSVPSGDSDFKRNFVPNRNVIFMAYAFAVAMNHNADYVAIAKTANAEAPDSTPAFFSAYSVAQSLANGNYSRAELYNPFVTLDTSDVVEMGCLLGVPFERTWSCYRNVPVPCGQCSACLGRMRVFQGIPKKTLDTLPSSVHKQLYLELAKYAKATGNAK